jgi:hypothetical protein
MSDLEDQSLEVSNVSYSREPESCAVHIETLLLHAGALRQRLKIPDGQSFERSLPEEDGSGSIALKSGSDNDWTISSKSSDGLVEEYRFSKTSFGHSISQGEEQLDAWQKDAPAQLQGDELDYSLGAMNLLVHFQSRLRPTAA